MRACVSQDNYVKPHALASFLFNRGLTISNMSKTTGIDGVSSRSYEDGGNSRFSNNNLTGGVETFVGCGVNVSVQSIGRAIYAETNLFDFVCSMAVIIIVIRSTLVRHFPKTNLVQRRVQIYPSSVGKKLVLLGLVVFM